jgi:pyruvate dehydrogenase E2 component (dihydrolipoamide acetyltransferase)
MATLLRMPEVAANATEAVLQDWSVSENGTFDAQDVLATIETEKAVVDVEAETAGVLVKALVPGGSRVEVGAPIAVIAAPGENVDDLDAVLTSLGVVAEAPALAPERRMVPDDPEGGTANTGVSPPRAGDREGGRIFTSPLARRMAAEAGLAVEDVTGTGPNGRIVRRDVEHAIAQRHAGPVEPGPTAEPVPGVGRRAPHSASRAEAARAVFEEVPHSRMRRAIASRLSDSKQSVPHFYLRATVRADRLVKLRARVNEAADTHVSLNDLVVKAVARTHVLVPEANVIWTPEAMRRFSTVDVALAVATDTGLVTPVLRGVERMPLSVVASTVRDMVARAQAGRLRQDELEGGSISVTNLGMFGVEEFAAIINPPQSAILAVGAVREEPVVRRGRLRAGTVMRVTLSADHRAMDGVLAARWMQAFTSVVEHPLQLLV